MSAKLTDIQRKALALAALHGITEYGTSHAYFGRRYEADRTKLNLNTLNQLRGKGLVKYSETIHGVYRLYVVTDAGHAALKEPTNA